MARKEAEVDDFLLPWTETLGGLKCILVSHLPSHPSHHPIVQLERRRELGVGTVCRGLRTKAGIRECLVGVPEDKRLGATLTLGRNILQEGEMK